MQKQKFFDQFQAKKVSCKSFLKCNLIEIKITANHGSSEQLLTKVSPQIFVWDIIIHQILSQIQILSKSNTEKNFFYRRLLTKISKIVKKNFFHTRRK